MERQKMLDLLKGLPGPITDAIVVYDDGCEFRILTNSTGYECNVGGAFPIVGPIKFPVAIYNDLRHLIVEQALMDEQSNAQEPETPNHQALMSISELLGEDALNNLFAKDWGPEKEFYVYHDMGLEESASFTSLQDAYNFFLSNFMNDGNGTLWDDMSDEELLKWCAIVADWRSKGENLLPAEDILGAYYSPMTGSGQVMELLKEEYDKYE
jgi:hypothetical protein